MSSSFIFGIFLALLFAVGAPVYALVGVEAPLTVSELSSKWKDATDFFNAGETGSFTRSGAKVAYRIFQKPSNHRALVMLPGYGEAPQKYIETIYDFAQRGYNVFFISHRGMGESQRLLANPQIIHIDDAGKYYSDADYFVDHVVAPRVEKQPVYLFTHSAGGLIGAHLLASRRYFFTKAVLSAPMFAINLHGYSRTTVWMAARLCTSTGYAPGFADTDPAQATFAKQTAVGSPARWAALHRMFIANPRFAVGGPSAGWILAMLAETAPAKIQALARRVTTPVLVFQAGDDTYVMPNGQDTFVKNAADATLILFPRARHEIHQEGDAVRNRALKALFEFYEE
jgi:lysophospholipase